MVERTQYLRDGPKSAWGLAFHQADLVISKGQANLETRSDIRDKRIFFRFLAKCPSVANALGCVRMAFVLTDNQMVHLSHPLQ
jgi:uncharacterized protein with ATP-grasp and redox domains